MSDRTLIAIVPLWKHYDPDQDRIDYYRDRTENNFVFSAKKSDMLLSDDIVYTRTQAKKLRKQGFIIPSYRVLAGKSERMNMAARMGHGSAFAHGDRAVVAVNR